ncbi:MAG: OpgC family protein [Phyllobacterium sp.]
MANDVLKQRDTRIDVFRALALLTIFVNHVPGTIFTHLTHSNFGFSDSAEAFVLISGIAVGMAYGVKFQPGNRLLLTLKVWRRAGVLYMAHIGTTMATLAIFCGAAIFLKRPEFLTHINIGPMIEKPAETLFGVATLGHQLGYNNILSMYGVLMLMLPVMLLLASISLRLLLAVSATLWLAAGVYQIAPPSYPNPGFWFLNPLSWQFLFAIGIAGMMHIRRGGSIPANPWLIGLSAAYVVISLLWVRVPFWGIDASMGLPAVLTGFDKTFLSLPRLAHVLALTYLIVSIPALSNLARTAPDHPLAILGKHSLSVFVAGTILSMAAQVLRVVNPDGLSYDAILIASGIFAQFALAYYLEWLPRIGWGSKPARAAKASPVPMKPRLVHDSLKAAS